MAVIFISRGTMSGVRKLVGCLESRPGLRFVSREDLVEVVNRHGELATRVVETLAKANRAYEQFSQLRRAYVVLMRQALLEKIEGDGVVYHGYSGHLLLPTLPHMVRVRIEAPVTTRLSLTMERLGCHEEEAADYIREEDARRVRWARFMYGQDVRNPHLYDIVLNLERMSMDAACRLLMEVVGDAEYACSEDARRRMDRLHDASAVEAALVSDPRTHTLEMSAHVSDEGLRLLGPYLEDEKRAIVLDIAGAVMPGTDIEYQPGYAPYLGVTA